MTAAPQEAPPRLECSCEDATPYKDALHDLVMLDAEEWAIGGGPGFAARRKAAWVAARELFEP